jgi:hypothetical protein
MNAPTPDTRRMEVQPSSVVAEVRFGVLAAKGELTNVREVLLAGLWSDGARGTSAVAHTSNSRRHDRGGGGRDLSHSKNSLQVGIERSITASS